MTSLNDQQSARDERSADDDRKEGRRCWTYPGLKREPQVAPKQCEAITEALAQIERVFGKNRPAFTPDAEDIAAAKANADGYTFSANYADWVSA